MKLELKKFAVLMTAAMVLCLPDVPAWAADGQQGRIELSDCRIRAGEGFPGIKARCGTLERPLDPANPAGGHLVLAIAVVPALSLEPEPDAFVPIAGGPGQASTEFYAAYRAAFESVRRDRDILLVDQRGTGQSAPLDCASDEQIIEGRFSREQTIADTEACLDTLPHDPRFFTTSVAVQDLEAVREALGYAAVNLYGISYGTRVAQHYLRRYPAVTRTVVLDGVVAPQIALGPGIAVEAQNALDAILNRCLEDEACNAHFPELRAEFDALAARLRDTPVTVTLAHPVTAEPEEMRLGEAEMAGAIRLLSYHPSTTALLPLLISEAAAGNHAPLAAQFLMLAETMSDALSIGMHNAVVCTEDAPYFAGENVSRDALTATYMGPLQLDALEAICSVWPRGPLDDDFRMPVGSDVPVLLLSGEADPITPPAYAELAASALSNARHLVGRRQGHGLAPRGCVPRLIGEFVRSADPASLDASCIEQLFAMPFFLDFSGPSP